jgi:hypothetical protein
VRSQVCRASLPGKSAGQVCRASLPGKSAGQDCRASLPGKFAGQVCRASLIKICNDCSQKFQVRINAFQQHQHKSKMLTLRYAYVYSQVKSFRFNFFLVESRIAVETKPVHGYIRRTRHLLLWFSRLYKKIPHYFMMVHIRAS